MKVTIYSKHYCPWCVKAKSELNRRGISYEELYLGEDLTKEQFLDIVGHNIQTVPQIIIDGKRIGGYEDLVRYFDTHHDW